jgi:hypothetical protein
MYEHQASPLAEATQMLLPVFPYIHNGLQRASKSLVNLTILMGSVGALMGLLQGL